MSPAAQIHRLTQDDVDLMRELNAVFAEAFEDVETYTEAPPDDAYFRQVLSRPHVIVMAAVKDGEVVGGLVAYVLDKLERARSEVYIYDLAVAEPHRRQGIAESLIAQLRKLAHEIGAWVVYVQADYGDDPAIALYEKLGVREEVMHFDLPVP
jgi:aminoglycoside 3-N-acetyltransferase I